MKKIALMLMMVSTLGLTACQTMTQGKGNKQLIGAGGGAVLGGLLGSKIGDGSGQLWATGAGVLIGALVGSEIGKSLDNADRAAMGNATYQAQSAPIGEPVSWNNPDSGHYGNVTATKDGYSSSGKYCREFQQTIYIDGKEEVGYGTACQQADGSWQIVNS